VAKGFADLLFLIDFSCMLLVEIFRGPYFIRPSWRRPWSSLASPISQCLHILYLSIHNEVARRGLHESKFFDFLACACHLEKITLFTSGIVLLVLENLLGKETFYRWSLIAIITFEKIGVLHVLADIRMFVRTAWMWPLISKAGGLYNCCWLLTQWEIV